MALRGIGVRRGNRGVVAYRNGIAVELSNAGRVGTDSTPLVMSNRGDALAVRRNSTGNSLRLDGSSSCRTGDTLLLGGRTGLVVRDKVVRTGTSVSGFNTTKVNSKDNKVYKSVAVGKNGVGTCKNVNKPKVNTRKCDAYKVVGVAKNRVRTVKKCNCCKNDSSTYKTNVNTKVGTAYRRVRVAKSTVIGTANNS